jgi:flagellar basal-body rod modification protein FlgD
VTIAIGNDTSTTSSAAAYMKQTTGLNKDDFMKLFVTQLQYQDPLAPQDSSAMVAQMAQLTQVEQSYNTNSNLQSLLSAANNAASLSAVSFIGKTIAAQGSQVNLTAGSQPQLNFNLTSAANQVQITIQDPSGRTVRSMTLGNTSAGDGSVAWDGKDANNAFLPPGQYSFTVTGVNKNGSTFAGTSCIRAKVDGVKLVQGSPVLSAGGIDVPLADVTAIKDSP